MSMQRDGNVRCGSMHKKTRGPLVVPFTYEGYLVDEVPPAVIAARRALGWPEKDVLSKATPNDTGSAGLRMTQSSTTTPAPGTPAPGTPQPCLRGELLVTAAGEVLKRRRKNGPWQPDTTVKRPTRGSAELACRIAEDREERKLAIQQFGSLKYAPTTMDT